MVDALAVERDLISLSKIGALKECDEECITTEGIYRSAWSAEESKSIEYIAKQCIEEVAPIARELEIDISIGNDKFGNFFALLGDVSHFVLVGSHLDTVYSGGPYDGTVGVVAGIETMRYFIRKCKMENTKCWPYSLGIGVVVWRGEEGTGDISISTNTDEGKLLATRCNDIAARGIPYKGSKAAFSQFDDDLLAFFEDLYSFVETEHEKESIQFHKYGKTVSYTNAIAGFIELHVEQGQVLEDEDVKIGVVTGIRGHVRCSVILPSGGGNAACEYLYGLNKLWEREFGGQNDEVVQTAGRVNLDSLPQDAPEELQKCAFTKVAGYSCLDIISCDASICHIRLVVEGIEKIFSVNSNIIVNTSGNTRVEFFGSFDHSGATPMWKRSDANLAAAYTVHVLNEKFSANPLCLHFNCAKLESSKIDLDIRGHNLKNRDDYVGKVEEYTRENGGMFEILSGSDPVEYLNNEIQEFSESCATELGLSYKNLPSGAGHDSAVVAREGIPTGMIFIPSKDGRSHCKEEFTSMEQIIDGIRVVAGVVEKFCQ